MTKCKFLFVLSFLWVVVLMTSPCDWPSASATENAHRPSSVGIDPMRLRRIYDLLQKHVQRDELPGAVLLIARKGQVAGLEAIGFLDLESKRPMKSDSIFRLASATKIITAVAALILYEEGKFALRDPVSDYLSELQTPRVYSESGKPEFVQRTLSIRDLLRHTSGYGYGGEDPQESDYRKAGLISAGPDPDWSHDMTLEQWVARLSTVPLAEEPGGRFRYGFSSDILGLLIERVSGQPLDLFIQKRILEPLNMKSSGFVVSPENLSRLTSVYDMKDGKAILLDRAEVSPFRKRPKALSGGGGWDNLGNNGLVSTAPDMYRLLQMLLNHGTLDGTRILSRKTVELMFQNHLSGLASTDSMAPGVGFGFGFAVLYDPLKYGELGSTGTIWWSGSTNVHYWLDPQEELIGVLMLQVSPFPYRGLTHTVRRMSFAALE